MDASSTLGGRRAAAGHLRSSPLPADHLQLVDTARGTEARAGFRDYRLLTSPFFPAADAPAQSSIHGENAGPSSAASTRPPGDAGPVAGTDHLRDRPVQEGRPGGQLRALCRRRFFGLAAAGTVPGMIDAWIGVLAYTFQIYFDFSGYSDMAGGRGWRAGCSASGCRSISSRPTRRRGSSNSGGAGTSSLFPVPARLPLYPSGRVAARARNAVLQHPDHHGDRRVVARRRLDLRVLGRAARGSDRRQPSPAAGDRYDPPRRHRRSPLRRAVFVAITFGLSRPDTGVPFAGNRLRRGDERLCRHVRKSAAWSCRR